MKRRWLKIGLLTVGGGLIAVISALVAGADLAVYQVNPVPAVEAAASNAEWDSKIKSLDSFEVSGGLPGSSAVVRFHVEAADGAEKLEIRLRRAFLSSQWRPLEIEAQ